MGTIHKIESRPISFNHSGTLAALLNSVFFEVMKNASLQMALNSFHVVVMVYNEFSHHSKLVGRSIHYSF